MKRLLVLFFVALTSCSTSKVITDFDDTIDFSKYKTYGFYQNAGNGLNELDIKRIGKVIDTILQKKGFIWDENPDFFIDFSVKITADLPRNTIAIGFGNAGITNRFGVSGDIPLGNKKVLETLLIEFLPPTNEQQIWIGYLESKVLEKRTVKQKEDYYRKVISKILNTYPTNK